MGLGLRVEEFGAFEVLGFRDLGLQCIESGFGVSAVRVFRFRV